MSVQVQVQVQYLEEVGDTEVVLGRSLEKDRTDLLGQLLSVSSAHLPLALCSL